MRKKEVEEAKREKLGSESRKKWKTEQLYLEGEKEGSD